MFLFGTDISQHTYLGDLYGWNNAVFILAQVFRVKTTESVYPSEVKLAVFGLVARLVIELIALQPICFVVYSMAFWVGGVEGYQPLVAAYPEIAERVVEHAVNHIVRQAVVFRYVFEVIRFVVVDKNATPFAREYHPLRIVDVYARQLAAYNGVAASLYRVVVYPFVAAHIQFYRTPSVCCHPQVAVVVFLHIVYKAEGLRDTLKAIIASVKLIQPNWCTGVYISILGFIEREDTVVIQRAFVPDIASVVDERMVACIIYVYAARKCTYPQVIAVHHQGMGIVVRGFYGLRKYLCLGIEIVEPAVFCGNPDIG